MFWQPFHNVAAFVDLTALNGRVLAKGPPDRLAQRLRAINDEQPADLGVEATVDQVIQQRLDHRRVLRRPLHDTKRMLVALCVDPDGGQKD
jgi:hypothetical protein